MRVLLGLLALVTLIGVLLVIPAHYEAAGALILCIVLSTAVALVLVRIKPDGQFLLQLFVAALLVRVIVGALINVFELQEFFGGDTFTYDFYGSALVKSWAGDRYYQGLVNAFVGQYASSAWGMVYMTGGIYQVIGHNMLAIQFTNAVLGAATAPAIFLIAHTLFSNRQVARISSCLVAFFPSLVLWSSLGLKDGPIVFLLVLAILLTLKLGEKFSLVNVVMLCLILATLISVRFYIFYMITAAVVGTFVIGTREMTLFSFIRQLLIVAVIGLTLTYMGVLRRAQQQAGYFGDLRVLETSRMDQARFQSGFGRDFDVSTPEGALSAAPKGIVYLLFAPFPWEMQNLRQSITLPEMLVWWGCFPFLILGLGFTVRYRLRQAFVILVFTTMLTLAYSVFQGNVGTAYRQRSQLLVFYFIFVAVGYVLLLEKHQEKKKQIAALRRAAEVKVSDRHLAIGTVSQLKSKTGH